MIAGTFGTIIYKIAKDLSHDKTTLDEKLQHVVRTLARYFKVEKCSIMLVNREDMTLEVRAATHTSIIGMKRKLSDVTISTRALVDDAPFYADKKRLSYFVPADKSRYATCNSLSLPMKYHNKKIGVINLTDTIDCKRMTKALVKEAAELTNHMAVYLYAAQANDLLERKINKYKNAMAQLVMADEMKTNLTSFIVHDLKGPISTIMANLDMLSYEPLNTQQFELVNLALNDTYKMQRMVMNILDVQKMEEGKISIYREETDLYELARREIMSFKGLLDMSGIKIVLEGGPRVVSIDENLIGRTISNLLTNAIEHSREQKQITVGIHYDAGRQETSVSVADDGIGIPDDLKERIFDKFFRIETGKMYHKTSTGLGLTFCKFVVEAHGGRLWVEDNEGGGTRFTFVLPDIIRGVIA